MSEDAVDREFKNISRSVMRVGLLIYSKTLECPNLAELRVHDQLGSEEDLVNVSERIVEKCNYFICNTALQRHQCNKGQCTYTKTLDSDLQSFRSRLDEIIEQIGA
jgi:hypothetical protein